MLNKIMLTINPAYRKGTLLYLFPYVTVPQIRKLRIFKVVRLYLPDFLYEGNKFCATDIILLIITKNKINFPSP